MIQTDTEKIETVVDVKLHRYGTQAEPAFLGRTAERPGYRWYVAYGGDYRPATPAEVEALEDYTPGYNPHAPEDFVGLVVRP